MADYLYLLRSLKDGWLYTGCTANIRERYYGHNRGNTLSARHRRPFELVYVEVHPDKPGAEQREQYLKSLEGGPEKFRLVETQTPLRELRVRWLGE